MAKKVLVIDDEPHILMVVEARLAAAGYEVFTESEGNQAVQTAVEMQPDLIVLDVNMPNVDGFRVLQTLRGKPETAKIPIIMLTGSGDTDSILKAQAMKVTDFVIKPFDGDEFVQVLERYI